MDEFTACECAYKQGYEKGLKDAVKHGRWISVEDGLRGEEFLDKEIILCKLNRFGGQLVYVSRFWGTHSALWNDITHWMPLPEPPETEV